MKPGLPIPTYIDVSGSDIKNGSARPLILPRSSNSLVTKTHISWLSVFAALAFGINKSNATTIVVIRTPDQVVIAADSSATITDMQTGVRTVKTACKIYEVSGRFFVIAGPVDDPQTEFSAPNIVARSIRTSQNTAAAIKATEHELQTSLSAEIPNIRRVDPIQYEQMLRGTGALTVLIAGMEENTPVANAVSFRLAMSGGRPTVQPYRDGCPTNCAPNGINVYWLGESTLIERWVAEHGTSGADNPVAFSEFLVQLEIDSGVFGVGAPIDILQITKTGPRWARRKDGCPLVTGN